MYEGISSLFEEAGEVYFEVGTFAETHNMGYGETLRRYQQSANCFVKNNSKKAYASFQKVVDVYKKYNDIRLAIEHCVEYGYKCGTKFKDLYQRDVFFEQADKMQLEHHISHTCVMRQMDYSKYANDFDIARADQDRFLSEIKDATGQTVTHVSYCSTCVYVYYKLGRLIILRTGGDLDDIN
ncbi:hypothetical protein RF11_05939 [Thelohanellus kitauei]|uniref:Alpha-soluble NSF attachment protein n=1 Tax=Thelohanellus kitauei TaxID=669202 RepID=A0A0C2J2F7_THEKT|nr:hypothetical protein RF11_05939 [Thelohanellus kitauei]